MENDMNITTVIRERDEDGNLCLASLTATIDGTEMSVPLDLANRHYAEILRQVDAGTLTIQDAD